MVTRQTLLEAREHPEKHRDLIVRVAGYSDYFINLTAELQDEIIRRTEQLSFEDSPPSEKTHRARTHPRHRQQDLHCVNEKRPGLRYACFHR